MPYELLIVEDDAGIIEALTGEFQQAFGTDMNVTSCGFKAALDRVRSIRPDILILDRFEGSVAEDAAEPIWDYIWNTHFCPIIVYSAYEATGSDYEQNHPFAGYQKKGDGSIPKLITRAKGFLNHADGLRVLRDEMDTRIANSLKAVSPLVWRETATLDQRSDLLRRVTRRRLAASLDSPSCFTDNVIALEQFICPPLEDCLLTGDIIQEAGSNSNDASAFRIVLTPSCDLQTGEKRHPVSEVLVAECVPVNDPDVLRVCTLLETPPNKLADTLGKKLKSDAVPNMCVLPALDELWPAMVVNLKKLALIDRTRIALDDSQLTKESLFCRVASVDSPFRESLAWRYAQTTGRPGLPDLDEAVLEQDIVSSAKALIGEERAGD
jgi:hypothetical protein